MTEEEKKQDQTPSEVSPSPEGVPEPEVEKKKGRLGRLGDAVSRVKDEMVGSSKKMADMTGKAVSGAMEGSKKVAGATGNVLKGSANLTYSVVKGTFYAGGKAVSLGTLLKNKALREQFGLRMIRQTFRQNTPKIKQEIFESREMTILMWKYARGKGLTDDEKTKVADQIKDLARVIPALGVFALPGGALLLPLFAKALPWSLLPSAFREEVAEAVGNSPEELKVWDDEVEKSRLDLKAPLPEPSPDDLPPGEEVKPPQPEKNNGETPGSK